MTIFELPKNSSAARAFLTASQRPHPFFLDGQCGSNSMGRWSFVGSDPFLILCSKDGASTLAWPRAGRIENSSDAPFELLRRLLKEYKTTESGPFPLASGGAVGYLSYDLFRGLEGVKTSGKVLDDLNMPDIHMAFYDAAAAFDHIGNKSYLAVDERGGLASDLKKFWLTGRLDLSPAESSAALHSFESVDAGAIKANFTRREYREAILKVKEYIAAGDVYQVNLSQRFSLPFFSDPIDFYMRLRRTSPAPFGACLLLDDLAILSNSPERYLLIDENHIETKPIKGTRPRGRTLEEDRALMEDLRQSPKDSAEHVMIVDLERNDLGRVCAYGSVAVPELQKIESYANVHHMVSRVAGRVYPSKDVVDCITNSFPGGSITGAPKLRAIEVIEEIEPTARGVYCGSIGYIDFSGRVDLNIAIRTAVFKNNKLYFQVGGGIVTDSDPEAEYEETLTKAQSFMKVITGEGRVWTEKDSA